MLLHADVHSLDLVHETSEVDPEHELSFAFPLTAADGTAATSTVYFEVPPGRRLGRHTDSAEEVLVVLEGTAEVEVGGDHAVADAGTVVVVPASVPHQVANAGEGTLRVVGVFAAAAVVSTFERPAVEGGEQVFVLGAPVPMAARLEPAGAET